jgi:hypothetical protein
MPWLHSNSGASMYRIDVTPVMVDGRQKATNKGTFYSAMLGDEILLDGTTEPFYNVARVLHSMGLTGEFGMWVADKLRMTGNIDTSSKLAVTENADRFGLVKFREFKWGSEDD